MASKYLDLYQGEGGFYIQSLMGFETRAPAAPTYFGNQRGTYRAGETQRVVHDKANNIYYGQQKQADLVKGLQDSIARLNGQLKEKGETRYSSSWLGGTNSRYHRYTAADRQQQNTLIKQQQNYLNHINSGGYKQESNKFYESYDAYTGDWNNVFNRRKSNADQKEANRLQEIQNEKTRVRNKKIEGQNQTMEAKAREAEEAQAAQGSQARAKKLTPNLEIGTGISASADKLAKSLGTGLGSSLNKTGLGI